VPISVWTSVLVSLATVAATLSGGWLVTTRVADYWDRVKKNRELNLTAANDFQRLYGEAVAIWKTWNALNGHYAAAFTPPEDAKWLCLLRATAAEGQLESLLAKVSAERLLSRDDIVALGGLRQAFKSIRRAIRADKPIPWWADGVREYVAFKSLASAMSVLLLTSSRPGKRPSATQAARAFAEITANRHEMTWTEAARHISSHNDHGDQLRSSI